MENMYEKRALNPLKRRQGSSENHTVSMISDSCNLAAFFAHINPGPTVYIYALCCPATGEIRYVGKTINILRRLRLHFYDKKNDHKSKWVRSIVASGKRPTIEILEVFRNSNDEDWQEAERFWITYLRFLGCRLTNLDSGGRGGKRMSAETKGKLSMALKGRIITDEARAKISAALRGVKRGPAKSPRKKRWHHSEESKAKLRAANLGRKFSEESISRMRAAQQGRQPSREVIEKAMAANRGRRITDQQRKRLRESHLGHAVTPETRAKIAAGHRGKKPTKAAIEKRKVTMWLKRQFKTLEQCA